MYAKQRFRLSRNTLAINSRHAAVLLPQGTVIELVGKLLDQESMVQVHANGEFLHAFRVDIEERGQPLKPQTTFRSSLSE